MPSRSRLVVRGSREAARRIRELRSRARRTGVSRVRVGFFRTARYQDGTRVAAVAAANEFGTSGLARTAGGRKLPRVPERPFFRQAVALAEPKIKGHLIANLDPRTMVVDDTLARQLGQILMGKVQERIIDLRDPPNAPYTLAMKKPKTNPLIDMSKMLRSVGVEVKERSVVPDGGA